MRKLSEIILSESRAGPEPIREHLARSHGQYHRHGENAALDCKPAGHWQHDER